MLRFLAIAMASQPQPSMATEGPIIPRTKMPLSTLVFGPDQQTVISADETIPVELCRAGSMAPDYKAVSILMWTGQIFRNAKPVDPTCKYSVRAKKAYSPKIGDIKTADCISRYKYSGDKIESIDIFVNSEDSKYYFQCEYRLSMAYLGFLGALSMPEALLFTSSTEPQKKYGYPIERAYSKVMPEPFVHLQWACRTRIGRPVFRPQRGQSRAQTNSYFQHYGCKGL